MSTLRNHCDARKKRAHELLDMVRAGVPVSDHEIVMALIALGEPV